MLKKLFIILLFTTACVTEKQRTKICETCPKSIERHDSIVEKEVIKFQDVYVYDTLVSWLPNPCSELCDENGGLKPFKKILTTNKGTKHILETKDNKLVLSDEINGLKETVAVKEKQTEHFHSEKTVLPADCQREHRNWLDKVARWWLLISVGAILALGLFKLGPRILKLLKF